MKKYTHDEILKAALAYFNGDELAANVWISKYAIKTKDDEYLELTPDDMFHRMAKEFARAESAYADKFKSNEHFESLSPLGKEYFKQGGLKEPMIYELFKRFERVIPQGSVMAQLGNTESIGSLSNCTVVDSPFDSYNGILVADLNLANLMKRRCGVGIDISTLRPASAPVSNAAKTSSGAVSFMERFSNTTKEVSQNGRRGALMITIDVKHPDVLQFATIKNNTSKVTGANISIKISDEFMEAVRDDGDFLLTFPIDADTSHIKPEELPYNVLVQRGNIFIKRIRAKALWHSIVESARNYAEPGLIFWDRQHKYSTSSIYPKYKNISTNPCSEIAMGVDSCRLISTNMFIHVDKPFVAGATFNFSKWYETIYYAQVLNDLLVDLEMESIQRIIDKVKKSDEPEHLKQLEIDTWQKFYDNAKNGRRTGLGFTGLGDTLAALGLKYDSDEALEVVEQIMETKLKAEFDASIDLAIIKGKFPDFDTRYEEQSEFVSFLKTKFPTLVNRMYTFGRRNISISTVAPNGSISLLAGNLTSGIEPLFMPFYIRRKKVNAKELQDTTNLFKDDEGVYWQEFNVCHPNLKRWIELNFEGVDVDSLKDAKLNELFQKSPYYNATAHTINWEKRVKLQSIIQKYVTHSISSTINLPKDVPVEEVEKIYEAAWAANLKGITIYRDGSRAGVLVDKNNKTIINDSFFEKGIANFRSYDKIIKVQAPKRPEALECEIYNLTAKGQRWTVLVGLLKNDPYEVWAYMNNGNDVKYKNGTIRKIKKDVYRLESPDGEVLIKNLNDYMLDEEENLTRQISLALRTGADIKFVVKALNKSKGTIISFAKAIARILNKYIKFTEEDMDKMDKKCPHCGDKDGLIYDNGCISCKSCGYSKCS